jgi:hypothetical protein
MKAKPMNCLGNSTRANSPPSFILLEVMVYDDNDSEEELSEADRRAITASREYFRQGGQGISFEQVAASCGLTMEKTRAAQKHS